MTINPDALTIFKSAEATLQANFTRLLEQMRSNEGTPVGVFMERVVAWRASAENRSDKKQFLFCIFEKAFNTIDDMSFFSSFGSFVGNCLLDDSYYAIEWRKPDYIWTEETFAGKVIKIPEIQYISGGNIKTMLTTKEDPDGRPFVVWAHDDTPNHETAAEPLLEAMDIMEQREAKRQADFAKHLGSEDE